MSQGMIPPIRRIRSSMSSAELRIDDLMDQLQSQQERTKEMQARITGTNTSEREDVLSMINQENLTVASLKAESQVAFVDTKPFQMVVATIILSNLGTLLVETDYPNWPGWNTANGIFLLAYVIELVLRFAEQGIAWEDLPFTWQAYDSLVVATGLVDFFYSIYIQALPGSTSVRCLMCSRLLRLPRIIRMHPPLQSFVQMLGGMMINFSFILAMIFLMCFVLAIMLTRLVGHGLLVGMADDPLSIQVRSTFSDMPTSLFLLFQLTTTDDWARVATPLVHFSHWWRFFFVAFITVMSWTMLSLLTAVASETLISEAGNKKKEDSITKELARHTFAQFLCTEFAKADSDANGELDRDEFESLMADEVIRKVVLENGIPLKAHDPARFWKMFDIDDSGSVTIQELVNGFSSLREGLEPRHIADLSMLIQKFSRKVESTMDGMDADMQTENRKQEGLFEGVWNHHSESENAWQQFLEQNQQQDVIAEQKRQAARAVAVEKGPEKPKSPRALVALLRRPGLVSRAAPSG
jgi:voltage-gated sodium channel